MAALETIRPAAGLSVSNLVVRFFATFSTWNDARITRKELSKLSSRELEDIGLTYGDIDTVAARVAR